MSRTLQEKLEELEGRVVTIRDRFIYSVKENTGVLQVTRTEDPPGGAYLSVKGALGACVADWDTIISEKKNGEVLILTGRRAR